MSSGVRIRWDRVCILLAAVTVLVIVISHAIIRGTTAAEPVDPVGEVPQAAAPVARPCPSAGDDVVRAAPHQDGQRTVALTFDDGPGAWTDDILAVLADEDVKATFFVVGREAAAAPDQVRQIFAAGHAVENHSWSHPSAGRSGRWNARLVRQQIERTSTEIADLTGQPPCFFRPPQGVVPGAERPARDADLAIALWSVDPRDWATHGAKAAATIRTRARIGLSQPNPMILLHDGGGDRRATVAALPGIIADYRAAGYTFVTLGAGRV